MSRVIDELRNSDHVTSRLGFRSGDLVELRVQRAAHQARDSHDVRI